MKEKRKIVIILSVAIFLCVFLLGGNTAFSVNRVDADFALATDYNYAQAQSARDAINRKCLGQNILFLSEETVKNTLEPYPYLALRNFEKKYPNVLRVEIEEKVEVFAFAYNGEYSMTDDEGKVYRTVKENKNVTDGGENFLFSGLMPDDKGDFSADAYYKAAFLAGKITNDLTGGIRTCFDSLTVYKPTQNILTHEFILQSKEGVQLHILNPGVLTDKKITAAVQRYLSLSDAQKLKGQITVTDDAHNPQNVVVI